MSLFIILIAITSCAVVAEDFTCSTSDALGPESLFSYPAKDKDRISMVIVKNGVQRTFSSRQAEIKLRYESQASVVKARLGYFTAKTRMRMFNVYSTNGSVTCLNDLDLNDSKDCKDEKQLFRGLTTFALDKNISRITGTQLNDGMFLFSIHTINQLKTADYYQVLVERDGGLQNFKQLARESPTALTSMDLQIGSDDVLTVAFDELIGSYRYNVINNTELILSNKMNYQLSRYWLGCKPDFCFDGTIDGATASGSGKDVLLYRGLHKVNTNYDFTEEKAEVDSIEQLTPKDSTSPYYLSSYDNQCTVKGTTSPCRNIFYRLISVSKIATIDAILGSPKTGKVYLIYEDKYAVYTESALTFRYENHGTLSDIWSGLPTKISGATTVGNHVIFIQDNFVYWTDMPQNGETASVFKVSLIQEIFADGVCNDDHYSQSASSQKLNISTFQEFKRYRMQFEPKRSATKTTVAKSGPKRKNNKYILLLILGFIALMICVLLAWLLMKKEQILDKTVMLSTSNAKMINTLASSSSGRISSSDSADVSVTTLNQSS
ncbi:hypothetical protein HDE_01571 [Halotydeus destructor]|nr:hypothetical protein HDE_01571 [Halotydeus destructor]